MKRKTRSGTKVCKYCGSGDLASQGLVCKACRKKQRHEYYEKNKEVELQRNKEWLKNHPGVSARYSRTYKERHGDKKRHQNQIYKLRRNYGISPERKQKTFEDQKGLCAISGVSLIEGNYHVDHNHKTKKLRGLITKKLNWAIGLFDDNPRLLRAAADYLEKNDASAD
jgi:Recombination endonuclease VII